MKRSRFTEEQIVKALRSAEASSFRVSESGRFGLVSGHYGHGLAALEEAMHQHIHLENNILFPRALAG